MIKLAFLSLAVICSFYAVSAQRRVTTISTTTTTSSSVGTINLARSIYPPAASGGPSSDSANPNISKVNSPIPNPTPTTITSPGNSTSPFTLARLQALERGNKPISSYPTQEYTLFLADVHFTSGNLSSQYIAYHYCHFVSADFMQCALYDGNFATARYIGNEFFITQAIFNTLPNSERNLWHSHPFEIQTGLFVAPDLPADEELEIMQWLMGTFGKVIEVWSAFENFPIGPPQVGEALSLVSQVNWTLATEMDRILNLPNTYHERQASRAGLIAPPRTPGADNYLFSGYATNYQIYSFPLENNGTVLGAANATGPAIANATAAVTGNVTLPASPANQTTLPSSSIEAIPGSTDSLPQPNAPTTI